MTTRSKQTNEIKGLVMTHSMFQEGTHTSLQGTIVCVTQMKCAQHSNSNTTPTRHDSFVWMCMTARSSPPNSAGMHWSNLTHPNAAQPAHTLSLLQPSCYAKHTGAGQTAAAFSASMRYRISHKTRTQPTAPLHQQPHCNCASLPGRHGSCAEPTDAHCMSGKCQTSTGTHTGDQASSQPCSLAVQSAPAKMTPTDATPHQTCSLLSKAKGQY